MNDIDRHIPATKNTAFNPALLLKSDHKMPVTRIVQRKNQFMILCSKVYHGGFNTGHNIADATIFIDF